VIILGIDPGLARLGWGVVEFPRPSSETASYGSFSTDSSAPLPLRLRKIHDTLAEVVRARRPDAAAMEDIFFAANVKTAVSMAYGRAAALLALAESGIELFDYSPLQIKQSVAGYGRASKEQVQLMVRRLIGLKETPKPDHAADALAVALCHGASLKRRELLGRSPTAAALEALRSGRRR